MWVSAARGRRRTFTRNVALYLPSRCRLLASRGLASVTRLPVGMADRGPPDIGGLISLKVDNFPFEMTCARICDARLDPPTASVLLPGPAAPNPCCGPQSSGSLASPAAPCASQPRVCACGFGSLAQLAWRSATSHALVAARACHWRCCHHSCHHAATSRRRRRRASICTGCTRACMHPTLRVPYIYITCQVGGAQGDVLRVRRGLRLLHAARPHHRCGARGGLQPCVGAGCSPLQLACSLRCTALQAPPPTVAGSATYGCRLRHLRLQARAAASALSGTARSRRLRRPSRVAMAWIFRRAVAR